MPILYTIGLLVIFFTLAIAEILVPSAGLLGLFAVAAAITAVLIAFTVSLNFALAVILALLVLTPILLSIVLRLWPQTTIGKEILNRRSSESKSTTPTATAPDGTPLTDLVGRYGVAASNLLPAGRVIVDGHKVDAVSTGMPIDSGDPIKVVRVQSGKLQVRLATSEESQAHPPTASTEPILPTGSPDSAITLDEVNLDDLDI
ncbi:NfeD family protein [Rhodopirellula europaea]|jgi:membrane-bound ClpP family serine protease|uniref:Nodulation efficiency, NfeD n=1 Tax=Rhodopirellula europaea SH398 TaxID=1263868 RepID=M5SCS8_9BACT|nr:NfeD family protein [Rhodopirellula europaea]EMI25482.1 Nodulation efficiency, NfeD [Rhodopirellula europaea SH398]